MKHRAMTGRTGTFSRGMAESSEKDLYEVLGADPSDSLQQLRHKYQQLALQFHPDRLVGGETSRLSGAVERFMEVEASWRILSDPQTRKDYDLQRRAKQLKQDGPMDSLVALEDMTWDQGLGVYTHGCRCGGGFTLLKEELEEGGLMEEVGERRALLVCCDTCSLSVCITWLHTHT